MGRLKRKFSRSVNIVALTFLLMPVANSFNLGLIAGDLKRHSSPLVIKKISKHSPVFININSGLSKSRTFPLPKLPPKPPPWKALEGPKSSKKLPRSILSPLPKLPLLPILPILPPVLPPLLPILPPLLPILPKIPVLHVLLPPLPILPKLRSPLKPLQVPIIKKSPLKALESKIKIPPLKMDNRRAILKILLDLKKKGSLTLAEYIKFKKLLAK